MINKNKFSEKHQAVSHFCNPFHIWLRGRKLGSYVCLCSAARLFWLKCMKETLEPTDK